eukprot:s1261_g5.t1
MELLPHIGSGARRSGLAQLYLPVELTTSCGPSWLTSSSTGSSSSGLRPCYIFVLTFYEGGCCAPWLLSGGALLPCGDLPDPGPVQASWSLLRQRSERPAAAASTGPEQAVC